MREAEGEAEVGVAAEGAAGGEGRSEVDRNDEQEFGLVRFG